MYVCKMRYKAMVCIHNNNVMGHPKGKVNEQLFWNILHDFTGILFLQGKLKDVVRSRTNRSFTKSGKCIHFRKPDELS